LSKICRKDAFDVHKTILDSVRPAGVYCCRGGVGRLQEARRSQHGVRPCAGADADGGAEQKEPGEVVDAEFEEVKENKK